MAEYKIVDIEFVNEGRVKDREVHVELDNGTIVKICACYESWQQWGGNRDELSCTVDVADCVNGWLHGIEEIPAEVYDYVNE